MSAIKLSSLKFSEKIMSRKEAIELKKATKWFQERLDEADANDSKAIWQALDECENFNETETVT